VILRRVAASLGLCAYLAVAPLSAGAAHAAAVSSSSNPFLYGQCTWFAANVRRDIGADMWGDASNWITAAHEAGLKTGETPVQGSLVIYQPGVQGAGKTGHVAQVVWVAPDRQHFSVDEMNFPVPGIVDHRGSWTEPGVTFIY